MVCVCVCVCVRVRVRVRVCVRVCVREDLHVDVSACASLGRAHPLSRALSCASKLHAMRAHSSGACLHPPYVSN